MPPPAARPRGWGSVFGRDRNATAAGIAPTLGRTMGEGTQRRGRVPSSPAYRAAFLCTRTGAGMFTLTAISPVDEIPAEGQWAGKIRSDSPALASVIVSDVDGEAARIAAVGGALAGPVTVSLTEWADLTVEAVGTGVLGATLILNIVH